MGKCQLCGKDAGLFRSVHKECKRIHDEGSSHIIEKATQSAVTQIDLSALQKELNQMASVSYIDSESLKNLLIIGFEKAISQVVLSGNILSKSEENALLAFIGHFQLTIDDVNKNGAHNRIWQSEVIRAILDGETPMKIEVNGALPFNFQKGETFIWLCGDVPYYELRTRTTYSGSSSGASFRIAKGIHYRVGSFTGNPVNTTETVLIDTGALAITDKHVYFSGKTKSFRIQYNKIVSFTPYSDGFAVHQDAASAKPQIFITGDGWFTYNLVTSLAYSQIQP